MSITGLKDYLWAAGFAANCVLIGILAYKRQLRFFPVFSTLIGFGVLRTLWLFSIRSHYGDPIYSHTYYGLALVDAGIQVVLVYEIARSVLRPHGTWAIQLRWTIVVGAAICLLVAFMLAYTQQPDGDDRVQVLSKKIDFFSIVLNTELFVGLVALSSEACLNWRGKVAGIAMGMGIYYFVGAAIALAARYEEAQSLQGLVDRLNTVQQCFYLACQIYWGYSLLQPEPAPRTMSPRMQGQVAALRDALVSRQHPRSKP